jgi:hypothetical protein
MSEVLKDAPVTDVEAPPGAVMTAGGAFGLRCKEGAAGAGLSETRAASLPEEDNLRNDMMGGEVMGLAEDRSFQGSL